MGQIPQDGYVDLGFIIIIIQVLINLSLVNKTAFMFCIYFGYLKQIQCQTSVSREQYKSVQVSRKHKWACRKSIRRKFALPPAYIDIFSWGSISCLDRNLLYI